MADATRTISREQVRVLLEIDDEFLVLLEREEIVTCDAGSGFSPTMLERIRVCRNLHHELGVNVAGLDVALRLLDTIRAERGQFREVLEWLGHELEAGRK
jgi:hypothetical protein